MIKNVLISAWVLSLLLLGGCGGSGGDTPTGDSDNTGSFNISIDDADAILTGMAFLFNGNSGNVIQGNPPVRSVDVNSPTVTSSPDTIETNRGSSERIDIVLETASVIDEVFVRISSATKHIKLTDTSGVSVSGGAEAISLIIGIPSDIEDGQFCVEVSVANRQGLISDTAVVCFVVSNQEGDSRVVHFADFSTNSTLSTLDFDNGDVNSIGATGYSLTDIAFLDGKLYGVTFTQLVEINTVTGEASLIGSTGSSGINALEGRNGILYAATTSGQFLTIDASTGLATGVSNFGSGAASSGDLVFDEDGLNLFGSVIVPGSATDQLIKVNPQTGETTFLGETGFNNVWGLAYFRNQLLGLTNAGNFIILNPETGAGTLVEDTNAFSAGGASAE